MAPIIWDNYAFPYETQEEIDRHYSQFCQQVHAILEGWFVKMESGSIIALPKLSYPKTWTDEQLNTLVETIDAYVDQQRAWSTNNRHTTYDAGPGFSRLSPSERLAFAQDLDEACTLFSMVTGPSAEAEPGPAMGFYGGMYMG